MKVEFIATGDLKPAPFNPVTRTSDNVLKDLITSMQKDGFWSHSPIVITKDNFIADGHRRWTTAKLLGIPKIPCLRTSKDLETAWAEINSTMRTVGTRDVYQAYRDGLRAIPTGNAGKNLSYVLNKYGEEMVIFCAENGVSKSPIQWAENVARYIGWDTDRIGDIVKWMVTNKMIHTARVAMESNYSRAKFAQRIEENRPLEFA